MCDVVTQKSVGMLTLAAGDQLPLKLHRPGLGGRLTEHLEEGR